MRHSILILLAILGSLKTTEADVLVDSIGSSTTTSSFDVEHSLASGVVFTTSDFSCALDSVDLMMNQHVPAPSEGRLFIANENMFPTGPVLATLAPPNDFAQDPAYQVSTYTLNGELLLAPNTTYVFVLFVTEPTGALHWQLAKNTDPNISNGSTNGPGFMPQITPVSPDFRMNPDDATNASWFDLHFGADIWVTEAKVNVTPQCETIEEWEVRRFSSTQLEDSSVSDHLSDPDADGLPNLLEYGLDTDPLAFDAPIGIQIVDEGGENHLAVAFRRRICRDFLEYSVEVSSDLSNWSGGAAHVVELPNPVQNGDGTETVTIRSLSSFGTREFLRLTVTKLEP